MLPLVYTHRGRGIVVLVSRHRDGEWIARTIERLGFRTARGSSTRGGEAAVRELLERSSDRTPIAITPDGPRGPAGRVKPGLLYLASRTGWPIVPVATAARRAWMLGSWDRFRVPLPFTHVHVAYGQPLDVPPRLDAAGEEQWGIRVEQAIGELTRRADAAVGAAVGGAA